MALISQGGLLLLCIAAQPGPAAHVDAPVSTRYVVEGWTVRDGLPQSSVTAITSGVQTASATIAHTPGRSLGLISILHIRSRCACSTP